MSCESNSQLPYDGSDSDNEELPKLTSKKTLMKVLNIDTDKNFRIFLQGITFYPYYKEYYLEGILPRQEEAKKGGKYAPRGPRLYDIQMAMQSGESGGKMKYSLPAPNKQGWSIIDHAARYLIQAKHMNCANNNGIFYLSPFSEQKIEYILHSLAVWMTHQHAPSQVNRQHGGKYLIGNLLEERPFISESSGSKRRREGSPEVDTDEDLLSGSEWQKELEKPPQRCKIMKVSEVPSFGDAYWQIQFFRNGIKGSELVDEEPATTSTLEWCNEIDSEEGADAIIQPTQKDVESFQRNQTWLDNQQYQRENHLEACSELEIKNPQIPRLPGMRIAMKLKHWQPTGIKAIIDLERTPALRGAILADSVGLGKTIEAIGYMLHWATTTPSRQAFPGLVVVPPSLAYQWYREVESFTEKLRPYLYYGDHRDTRGMHKHVEGRLTAMDEYFDGRQDRAFIVIITSYATLNCRHGPTELRSHRIKGAYTKKQAAALLLQPDPEWKYHLGGLFDRVVLDEAHLVRNPDAMSSHAVLWLEAKFYLCLTATPLINSHFDFKGLSFFIIQKSNEEFWKPERLIGWGVDEDINPFDLPRSHPAAVLMLTHKAMNKFIWDKDLKLSVIGTRLRSFWELCLIRRTLMSSLPFDSPKKIGHEIPPCRHQLVQAPMTAAEKKQYNKVTPELYQGLVRRISEDRFVYNNEKLRRLCLLTTWIDFEHIQHKLMASSIPKAVNQANRKSAIAGWLKTVASKTGNSETTFKYGSYNERLHLLTYVLRSSSRLRAFLPIITHQALVLKEKAIVWCAFPAQQVLIAAVLQLGNIDAQVLHASLNSLERTRMCEAFNENRHACHVLICTYSINSVGLNLQRLCRNVHLFDIAGSQPITEQAIGRCWRIGQEKIVKVYSYHVPDSFNSQQMQRVMEKHIPGLIAELNHGMFKFHEGANIELGRWCQNSSGEVIPLKANEPIPEGSRLLQIEELARLIHEITSGIKE